ncbi:MAG: TonB-dependent receptor [Steroidobacteraceae bacterium]
MTDLKLKPLPCAVLAALALSAMAPAHAQREAATVIEEITITAQKREEALQTVPVAVTALDSAALERTYARDLLDVTDASPNLIIDPILGNGTAAISIRGLQLNDVEKSFDPAVSVYLDGVYLASTTGALLQIWDAEAVEVLRGPQGTLFGRNTIGGLVHVRRKKPSGEWGGRMTVTTDEWERFDANVALDFPSMFNDTLAVRTTLMMQSGGGYFRNVSRNRDEGDTDFFGFSANFLWTPTDNFEAWLIADIFRDETPTRPVTALTQPGELFCLLGPTACGAGPNDTQYHLRPTTTFEQEAFVHTDALTLNAVWDLDDNNSIHAVVGWRDTDEDAFQEFDGVALDAFRTRRPTTADQTSIELRWQGEYMDGKMRTVLGGFWWESEYELVQRTTSYLFFGFPPYAPGAITSSNPSFRQKTETTSLFGQVDYDFSDRWTLTVGGRYNKDDKQACGARGFNFFGVGDVTLASYGKQGYAYCGDSTVPYLSDYVDPVTGESLVQDGDESWNSFTPKVSLTYALDNGIAYASYSEGFKAGGFNGRSTAPNSLGPYDPEEVKTIEVGAKTTWMDQRLQFNVAAFTTDYTDKQEDVVFPDPDFVTVTIVQNAASATISGLEAELVAIPVDGLTLNASIGLLDAKYDKWVIPDTAGNPTDKSDLPLRRAPDLTMQFGATYEKALGNGYLVLNATYNWRDDYWVIGNSSNTQPGNPGFNPSYGILDAAVSYETDQWRVSLYGKNLADEHYWLHVLDVGASYAATSASDPTPVYFPGLWTFGTLSPPRTFGLEVDFKF